MATPTAPMIGAPVCIPTRERGNEENTGPALGYGA